jgi:hypothetical protein
MGATVGVAWLVPCAAWAAVGAAGLVIVVAVGAGLVTIVLALLVGAFASARGRYRGGWYLHGGGRAGGQAREDGQFRVLLRSV